MRKGLIMPTGFIQNLIMKKFFTLIVLAAAASTCFATAPTTPSSNLIVTNIEGNNISFSWMSGNGANRLIIARKDNPVTAQPVNGTDYIANNTFGLGNEISAGQFVVYKGNGTSFNLNGLVPNSTYHIAIFEFNGTDFSTEYLTAVFLNGSRATLTAPGVQVGNLSVTNITGNSMRVNYTAGNGSSRLILAKANNPVDANPVDLVSYFASSQFGAGDQIGSGNYVVAKSGTSATITDLQPNTTYYFAAFEFNGNSGPVYLTVSPPTISQATALRPTVTASNLSFSAVEGNSMNLTFSPGNGAKRIIIAKAGSPVTAVPVDGITYTANNVFGSGQQVAPNEYVISNGTQSFAGLSNLQHSTIYHFAIFEYDGTGTNTAYLTSSFLAGSNNTVTQPTLQTSNLVTGTITNNSITLNWTNGNGTNRIVVARQGSAVNALPVNYTNYSASVFGSGSQIGTGNYVVYKGSGSTTTITGLSFGHNYHFTMFELNGISAPVYITSSPPVVNATTSSTPTVPSSNLVYNSTEGNGITMSWTSGNGTGRIVVAKAGSPVTGLPVNTTAYTASTSFGAGSVIAAGEFVVYNGAGTSFALTNLSIGTTYHFAVFEYNGAGATTAYLTSSFLSGSGTTLTTPTIPTASISFSNITGNAMQIHLAPGNGQKRLVLVKEGSPVDTVPSNLTSYTAVSVYGSGSQIGTGNYVIMANSQSSVTLTGLQPNTVYYFTSFEFNGSSGPVYNNVSPAAGNASTLQGPTVPSSNLSFSNIEGNSMQLLWTSGNGTKRIVIARRGSSVTAVPSDGTNYTASSVFGSGTEIVPGQFVIANTASNFTTLTNLSIGSTYYFAIYEYDGSGANTGYLTSSFASGNATTVSAPTVQATNFQFTNITSTSMTVNWTNGNGSNKLIIIRADSPVTAAPVNLTSYSASSQYSFAGQVTPGNFAVYKGTGSSVNITGLQPNTIYHFSAFEFNGNSAPVYLITSPPVGNATTVGAPQVQASNTAANAINPVSATISWTNGNGQKRMVLMKANTAVDASPADGGSYIANTFFGSGAQLGSGNYVVYAGIGNSVTVTNLNLANTYHVAVFEYNDFGAPVILYLAINPSRAIVTLNAPQVQASNAAANAVTLNSATISWVNGNGHKRIVLMKANAPVDVVPVDNTNYTADSIFASGTQIGTGNYVVFNGTANTDTISGINLVNTYHIAVFEYNDFGVTLKRYQVNNPARTNFSGVPQVQASNVVVNSIGNTSAIIGWTNGSGHKRIVLIKANTPVDVVPENNNAYIANTVFGSGSQIGGGNYTVFSGSGNNVTVTGLLPGNTYHIAVFEFNELDAATKIYLTATPARGTILSGTLPVTFINFSAKETNGNIQLQWSTVQEFNSAWFEVQRSGDGVNYVTIGQVSASGNSSSRHDYSYMDVTALSGRYYYRLRQVDINANFIFSNVVTVELMKNYLIKTMGNPIKDELKFVIDPRLTEITISLFDMQGKLVIHEFKKNQNIISIDARRLNAGVYLLQVASREYKERVRIMKTN